MFTSWTFSQRYLFYVHNDTTSRNCSSIINVNREKCQIMKSQCWRYSNKRLRSQIQYWMVRLNPKHTIPKYECSIIFKIKVAMNNNIQNFVSLRPWIKYSSCLHWIMLNHFNISDGFCLDTFYAILMNRDIGRTFLQKKWWEFCSLTSTVYGKFIANR